MACIPGRRKCRGRTAPPHLAQQRSSGRRDGVEPLRVVGRLRRPLHRHTGFLGNQGTRGIVIFVEAALNVGVQAAVRHHAQVQGRRPQPPHVGEFPGQPGQSRVLLGTHAGVIREPGAQQLSDPLRIGAGQLADVPVLGQPGPVAAGRRVDGTSAGACTTPASHSPSSFTAATDVA